MPNVLCTALNTDVGPHFALLKQAGFEVIVPPSFRGLYQNDVLLATAQTADAVIAGSEPWPRHVIEQLPRLRVLSRTGVGFDAIDLAACDDRHVVVATTPGVNHHAVAEHTIALLMGLARGFPKRDQDVRTGHWERVSGPRVMGRTLGVVGLGRIGQAVATRALGLGMRVVAYDPFPNGDFIRDWKLEMLSLDDLFARSDYVSLHLPVSRETQHIINARSLAKMKRGAALINTARGALVDEAALYDALMSGQLSGAGLDVFEIEPLPLDSPLLRLSNVLLSGHVAGLDDESQHDTLTMAADTIIQLQRGDWPTERIRNLAGVSDWKW
ncbi:MAG TPA: phosphoglycerate dehydrogenase [Planctomycetaceae bacterium]|nr:phosphoglycerate dehydrogenase [Planctomycetaceae bacterium]